MLTTRRLLLVLAALVAAAAPLRAQSPAEREVRGAIDRLFAGMRSGDSAVVRSVFHPEARLMTTTVREGQTVVRSDPIDGFVRAVGTPHPEVWDERISNVEIRVDDGLATAWMNYSFYAGSRFSHCGVNAFQLVRAASGWQVVQIMDTRRQSGCGPAGG